MGKLESFSKNPYLLGEKPPTRCKVGFNPIYSGHGFFTSIFHKPPHHADQQPAGQNGATGSPGGHRRHRFREPFRRNQDSFRGTGQHGLPAAPVRRPDGRTAAFARRKTVSDRRQHALFGTTRECRRPPAERYGERLQPDLRTMSGHHCRRTERHRLPGNRNRRRILHPKPSSKRSSAKDSGRRPSAKCTCFRRKIPTCDPKG